jgi:cell wall-associated NlpC family hydrolase
LESPRLGAFGVVKTHGLFGFLIRLGTFSRWNHCVIYVGDGMVVEANLRGVQMVRASKYTAIAWNHHEVFTEEQGWGIFLHALGQIGKPYNFLDILNISLRIIGLKVLTRGLLSRLAESRGFICSELVAECYQKVGLMLGKIPCLFTPGDLAERMVWQ